MDTTLVVLAAGIGSRYGQGIKQLEKIGPGGEMIIDYSAYDAKEAASLVKYLETSINRDTKEMYNVTLQQTFEQLTFGDTGMKLVSDLYYDIYQAQEYSYNIVARFLSRSGDSKKEEYFINKYKLLK